MKAVIEVDVNLGMGKKAKRCPWSSLIHANHFHNMMKDDDVIVMGSATLLSMPMNKFNHHDTIIITSTPYHEKFDFYKQAYPNQLRFMTFTEFNYIRKYQEDNLILIGGYDTYMSLYNVIHELHVIYIHGQFDCDTYAVFFNEKDWKVIKKEQFGYYDIFKLSRNIKEYNFFM